jgi:hypothetical protein
VQYALARSYAARRRSSAARHGLLVGVVRPGAKPAPALRGGASVCTHDAGSFHRVSVEDLFASRLFATQTGAILTFWRFLGDVMLDIWLASAK